MTIQLTPPQRLAQSAFQEFANQTIAPLAPGFDAAEHLSRELIAQLGARGYLAATLGIAEGTTAMDMVTYGLLTEEVGRVCSTVRNFIACQDMVATAIAKFAGASQRERWLARLAAGDSVGAFCLTEPGVGSDARQVSTEARDEGGTVVLSGRKKWISFGQIADILLVFAQYEGRLSAFLVDPRSDGVNVKPLKGLLGLRGSMLAEIEFDEVAVPAEALVGRPGTGLSFVASTCLDLGRYSTAWGSVGLAQACLEESVGYAARRTQSSTMLMNHQLVQRMIADLVTDTTAARLLCQQAGLAKQEGDPDAARQTFMAKYLASRVAVRAADNAVQIHGAHGIGGDSPVQRLYRDAKIMELIEGTTQIHQSILGRWAPVMSTATTRLGAADEVR